jgi:hypothetical protein
VTSRLVRARAQRVDATDDHLVRVLARSHSLEARGELEQELLQRSNVRQDLLVARG